MTESHLPFILRTSKPFYWLIGGILSAPLMLGLFGIVAMGTIDFLLPTLIITCFLAMMAAIFLSTKLVLNPHSIHYRSLFVTKSIPLADVINAKFVVGFSVKDPYQRLIVTIKVDQGTRDIIINTGLFDRTEIKRWLETLKAQLNLEQ